MSIANGTGHVPRLAPTVPGAARGKRRGTAPQRPTGKRVTQSAAAWGNVWAYGGVGGSLAASAVLNGLAFAEHAGSPWLAWGLGLAVPGFVLVVSRVAALAWARGERGLAGAGGVATLAVLLLSVQHLAVSISRITGEHWLPAAFMALAIDLGLVVCELFTLRR